MSRTLRRLAAATFATGATYAGITLYTTPPVPTPADRAALAHGGAHEKVPSRAAQLARLRAASTRLAQLDVLVIGGGATGTAVALDATLRDLDVALVERDDFSAGTSSRSTKLIHGGVRYLEKAFFQLDPGQLKLVFEALGERSIMLHQAPHLAQPFPTLLPCYKIWEVPFYWLGLKTYDLLASLGHGLLHVSRFVSASEALRLFPTLSRTSAGQQLRGSIMYYDGQMDDSRFNVSVAVTAAMYGAAVANHTEVVSLLRDEESGRISGVRCRDVLSDEQFDVFAKVVVNATGPFTDTVRKMDDSEARSMVVPSAGVHITLPSYYSPDGMGLIVPKTKDGRVVFMLPWLGQTIAGTTDSSTEITELPRPHPHEVEFILDALSDYLRIDVRASDVQSAWSGIRPLAIDPDVGDDDGNTTQNILREHAVTVSPDGLVTVAGGKWTMQRAMGEHTVDRVVEVGALQSKASKCKTKFVRLVGAHKWDESYFTFLSQRYVRSGRERAGGPEVVVVGDGGEGGKTATDAGELQRGMQRRPTQLDIECAKHLSRAYGDQAYRIAELAERGLGARLVDGYPVLEAEVEYCVENEYCETAADFLARRSRLAFLDCAAARQALPRVVELMARRLAWSEERKRQETQDVLRLIESFTCMTAGT